MIRDAATQRQVDAASPRDSTWLSANAGSGKTRVLTDRVARLLLQGVSPQNILCLTYTKAAAAEMQNRLFARLGNWAMKDDATLRSELAALGVENDLDARQLSRARTLFASAIETPGGLKIQTIHAFCASILRRFPLEANISPQFQEIEDRAAKLLQLEVADAMANGPDRPLMHRVLSHFTGADFGKLLGEIVSNRRYFSAEPDAAAITACLGLSVAARREDALAIAFAGGESALVKEISDAFADQSDTYKKFAAELRGLALDQPGWADFAVISKEFLYSKDGTSKSVNFPQARHTKAVAAAEPIAADLHDWMDRTYAAHDFLKAIDIRDRSLALHGFAHRFITLYSAAKQARGLLDFDDLIEKAGALLAKSEVADWVLYRLDGGVDHMLVDEAQDTSPAQWDVVKHLTQELVSGAGRRNADPRTIFVVGDKKQSIYSFQGADPAAFDEMRAYYAKMLSTGAGLQSAALEHSFRSSTAILSVVDATFDEGDPATAIGGRALHTAFHADMPGRVDLWPVIEAEEKKDADDGLWYQPIDMVRDSDPVVQLANQIASQIKRMIDHEYLPVMQNGQQVRRRITPGDFLILVQRRSVLFSEIIRACKSAGIAVAGADRFRVGAVLAVQDIMALLSFLALPEDDLSLAATLRSPLFGWSEQQLYTLAHDRPGLLWEALRNSGHTDTLAILSDLLDRADFLRPYDLIDRILTRHDGRRRLLARLGAEAEDGIDALLAQAIAYESLGVPSLTGFLSWVETDELEVKRQIDRQSDQLRVMSVHGAKGLEAPIVILPDAAERANNLRDSMLKQEDLILWAGAKPNDPEAVAAIRAGMEAAQARERLRLLYVAMTRAEQWLIVAAAGKVINDGESWHQRVAAGMEKRGAVNEMAGELEVKRLVHGDWHAGPVITDSMTPPPAVMVPLVLDPLPEVTRTRTLSPSVDLGGAKTIPGDDDGAEPEMALARGHLLHLLLEHLPDQPPGDRRAAARRVIAASDALLPEEITTALIDDALRILDSASLAFVFAPDSRAEVAITAALPELDGARIHGTIDRLIIADDHVLAVDFKSNRSVPESAGQVPEGILRQMGAYAAALAQIYPGRRIETAILWTHSAGLMPLPTHLVASALRRVTTS